uniref:Uncharacterized protein n=1 Tax=Rhizophora mucronata TaxID=61149 RepID=A0A2P2NFE4_RHIMU
MSKFNRVTHLEANVSFSCFQTLLGPKILKGKDHLGI